MSNTSEQRLRSDFCERVIRREATETEGLVLFKSAIVLCVFVCLFVCPELIGKTTSPTKLKICIQV